MFRSGQSSVNAHWCGNTPFDVNLFRTLLLSFIFLFVIVGNQFVQHVHDEKPGTLQSTIIIGQSLRLFVKRVGVGMFGVVAFLWQARAM